MSDNDIRHLTTTDAMAAERFLQHTWTIRTISPFAIPLFSSSSHCCTLELLEEELSRSVRRAAYEEDETTTAWSEGGTYVTLAWIELLENDNKSRHLHMDICVHDAIVGNIVLCFCSQGNSFSFVLSRGQAIGVIMKWLESNLGCSVGLHPFMPSPSDVASILSTWTTLDGFVASKPLQLSFAGPSKELSNITFSIPTVALAKLCREMERLQNDKGSLLDKGKDNDNTDTTKETGERSESSLEIENDGATNCMRLQTDGEAIPPGSETENQQKKAQDVQKGEQETSLVDTTDDLPQRKKPKLNSEEERLSENCNHLSSSSEDELVESNDSMSQDHSAQPATHQQMAESLSRQHVDSSHKQTVTKAAPSQNDQGESISNDTNPSEPLQLPVLRAVQQFAWEALHINIQSLSMIRASSAVAVLGCDGRCRFTDETHLLCVLKEIETMITNRIVRPGVLVEQDADASPG